MIVERRSLTRRTSLEDHMQTAIDTVRGEVIEDAVSDAMTVVDGVPADLRVRTLQALHRRVSQALAPQSAPTARKAHSTPRDDADALFKTEAA